MDIEAIRADYDRIERAPPTIPGMLREESDCTVRFIGQGLARGAVLRSDLDAETADAVIDAAIARFRSIGQRFEWKLHDYDAPTDLRDRLVAKGFAAEPDEALVALDLSLEIPSPAPSVALRVVSDRSAFEGIHEIRRAAFGRAHRWQTEALEDEWAADPLALSVYVASVDGAPAAAGWMRTLAGSPFATLWGGGTIPSLRRRGAYRTLVAGRLIEAKARGCRYALVDAGPESLPILERLGFVVVARMVPMVWRPEPTAG